MRRRVQLDVGGFGHQLYREQLHAAPEGWEYVYDNPSLTGDGSATKRIAQRSARWAGIKELGEAVALRVLSEAGYVHRVRTRPLPGVELLHEAERLLRDPALPYVVDLEHVELFVLYQRAALDRARGRTTLERCLLDERLRYLLPWSEAARRSVLAAVSPRVATQLEPKLRTVLPAIRPAADRPRERAGGPLRVLFVGTVFFEKGGVDAVRAIQAVRRSHDVTLDVVSYVPREWQARLENEDAITIHPPGGVDVVQRLYARSDVLLFPSHMDTFGYVVLEAMAHALPVLAPRHLALTELVQEGVSGVLFPPENMLYREDTRSAFRHVLPPPRRYLRALREPSPSYVAAIAAALSTLAADRQLYGALSAGALASVQDGALSIGRRRRVLGEIYDAAVG